MKTIVWIAAMAIGTVCHAQSNEGTAKKPVDTIGGSKPLAPRSYIDQRLTPLILDARVPHDTVIKPSPWPPDRMPNAITKSIAPVYKGNNGRGFDVYESTIDNMPILMPDSANRALLQMPGRQVPMRKPLQLKILPLAKP